MAAMAMPTGRSGSMGRLLTISYQRRHDAQRWVPTSSIDLSGTEQICSLSKEAAMTDATLWRAIDSYFVDRVGASDATLEAALAANAAAGLPAIDVSPAQGKL